MTRAEILKYYPNATESFIRRNLGDSCPAHPVQNPEPKPIIRDEPARTHARKESGSTRVKVRVLSRRIRLLDADNLAGGSKFIIDAMRYQGLIRDDCPAAIELSFSQMKVSKKTEEETVVIIERIPEITGHEAAQIYANYHRETNGNP